MDYFFSTPLPQGAGEEMSLSVQLRKRYCNRKASCCHKYARLLNCALGLLHVVCSGFLDWFLRKPFNVLSIFFQRRYREGGQWQRLANYLVKQLEGRDHWFKFSFF